MSVTTSSHGMGNRPSILVIDDEADLAEILVDVLSDDFDAKVALTAGDAFSIIQGEKFDVILTDVNIPGCSGQKIVEHARTHAPTTPVVLLTGQSQQDIETRAAMNAGAVGYVSKPFGDGEELVKYLKKFIK